MKNSIYNKERNGYNITNMGVNMKVSDNIEYTIVDGELLKARIKKQYRNVRHFAQKAGYSESMICKILYGKRKLYPWSRDLFADMLGIPRTEYKVYFGEGDAHG